MKKVVPEIMTRRFRHPFQPMALYLSLGGLITFLSLRSEPRPFLIVFFWILLGIFAWTLIEYFLHRFIFHWTQGKEPWRTLASGLHMEHHQTANHAEKILAPPLSSLVIASWIYLAFVLLTFSFTKSALLETGVFIGYLAYEWVHFGAHRFQPHSRLGRFLKTYHLYHHFKDPKSAFGVTSPLWDILFKTPAKFLPSKK